MSVEGDLALQYLTEIDGLKEEIRRLREREAQLAETAQIEGEGAVTERAYRNAAEARAEAAEARVAKLERVLRELERAATEYANENGVSGDFGARLYDARRAVAHKDTGVRGQEDSEGTDAGTPAVRQRGTAVPDLDAPPDASALAHKEETPETPCSICGSYGHFTHNHGPLAHKEEG